MVSAEIGTSNFASPNTACHAAAKSVALETAPGRDDIRISELSRAAALHEQPHRTSGRGEGSRCAEDARGADCQAALMPATGQHLPARPRPREGGRAELR